MSDTTDLMGVNAAPPESEGSGGTSSGSAPAEKADAPATDASAAPASGAAPKRRRSGTGLEGMVLAELQQVASGLGIKGTARMRKNNNYKKKHHFHDIICALSSSFDIPYDLSLSFHIIHTPLFLFHLNTSTSPLLLSISHTYLPTFVAHVMFGL